MEKVSMTMGLACSIVWDTVPLLIPSQKSLRLSRVHLFWFLPFDTLLIPGSFPTTRMSVLPEIALVTLPPKLMIIPLTLSLPKLRPEPPPTSGKTPVRTQVFPPRQPGFALPTPGLGRTNFSLGTREEEGALEEGTIKACGALAGGSAFTSDFTLSSALGVEGSAFGASIFFGDADSPAGALLGDLCFRKAGFLYWAQFPRSITCLTSFALCSADSSCMPSNRTSFSAMSLIS
mmetsp:Transcript_13851/g.39059  ORF Transcript_13851/g.39059 Transcript_13851/m.39059 type:complete len:233 (-) Transcript_13851:969-1667(-)